MAKQRQRILGVRMTQERQTELKSEAARRGISVADLFEEMWNLYRKSQKEAGHAVAK